MAACVRPQSLPVQCALEQQSALCRARLNAPLHLLSDRPRTRLFRSGQIRGSNNCRHLSAVSTARKRSARLLARARHVATVIARMAIRRTSLPFRALWREILSFTLLKPAWLCSYHYRRRNLLVTAARRPGHTAVLGPEKGRLGSFAQDTQRLSWRYSTVLGDGLARLGCESGASGITGRFVRR